jgi:hypothetical protein
LPKTLRCISLFEHFDLAYEDLEDECGQIGGGAGNGEDGSEDFVAEDGVNDNGVVDESNEGAEEDIEYISNAKTNAKKALACTVARRSFELKELSVAFMFDARDFFQPFVAERNALPYWPSLRWLSLTSYVLQNDTPPAQLNGLFLVAAKAARLMPALRAMVSGPSRGPLTTLLRIGASAGIWGLYRAQNLFIQQMAGQSSACTIPLPYR